MDGSDEPRWEPVEVGGATVEVRVGAKKSAAGCRLWPSVGEYPVYDDFLYYVMLQDEPRNALFTDAITRQAPGRVVLELGTGPDLLWSTLAARSGASRVMAVEVIAASAREARERARRIGPHVSVVEGDATRVELPERADMCIAELVGAIGGAEGIAEALDDARRRHLRPDAVVVPHRVRTPIAAVGASALLDGEPALHPDAAPYVGQVLGSVGAVFDLRMCLNGLTEADLATTTDVLEDLDLGANTRHHARGTRLHVTRPGTIDSCVLWLQLQCAPDQTFLDSLVTATNWMPVLVPFDIDRPLPVGPGDVLDLDITRRLHDGVHPRWSFTGALRRADGSLTPVRADSPYADGPFRASWLHRALFRGGAAGVVPG